MFHGSQAGHVEEAVDNLFLDLKLVPTVAPVLELRWGDGFRLLGPRPIRIQSQAMEAKQHFESIPNPPNPINVQLLHPDPAGGKTQRMSPGQPNRRPFKAGVGKTSLPLPPCNFRKPRKPESPRISQSRAYKAVRAGKHRARQRSSRTWRRRASSRPLSARLAWTARRRCLFLGLRANDCGKVVLNRPLLLGRERAGCLEVLPGTM